MPRTLTTEAIESVTASSTDTAWIGLAEITHEDLDDDILLANDAMDDLGGGLRGVTSNGEDYVFLPFDLVLPSDGSGRLGVTRIEMDNVSREIYAEIEALDVNSPPDVRVMTIISSAPDDIQQDIEGLKLREIVVTEATVQLECSGERFDNEEFPFGTYNRADFPGLFV